MPAIFFIFSPSSFFFATLPDSDVGPKIEKLA